jgi:hypothetical protein
MVGGGGEAAFYSVLMLEGKQNEASQTKLSSAFCEQPGFSHSAKGNECFFFNSLVSSRMFDRFPPPLLTLPVRRELPYFFLGAVLTPSLSPPPPPPRPYLLGDGNFSGTMLYQLCSHYTNTVMSLISSNLSTYVLNVKQISKT